MELKRKMQVRCKSKYKQKMPCELQCTHRAVFLYLLFANELHFDVAVSGFAPAGGGNFRHGHGLAVFEGFNDLAAKARCASNIQSAFIGDNIFLRFRLCPGRFRCFGRRRIFFLLLLSRFGCLFLFGWHTFTSIE